MVANNRCLKCAGSGKVMGIGMMYIDCLNCDGQGTIYRSESEKSKIVITIDKRSAEYKAAIKKIMESGSSKEEAVKIFEQEFEKL